MRSICVDSLNSRKHNALVFRSLFRSARSLTGRGKMSKTRSLVFAVTAGVALAALAIPATAQPRHQHGQQAGKRCQPRLALLPNRGRRAVRGLCRKRPGKWFSNRPRKSSRRRRTPPLRRCSCLPYKRGHSHVVRTAAVHRSGGSSIGTTAARCERGIVCVRHPFKRCWRSPTGLVARVRLRFPSAFRPVARMPLRSRLAAVCWDALACCTAGAADLRSKSSFAATAI